MTTVATALREGARRLTAAGVDSARLDSRLLLAAALGVETGWLFNHPDAAIDASGFEALLQRRCNREPMSLILGRREFWSLDFTVTADTLAPRPDSEAVIEAVTEQHRGGAVRILDLGTGSGCLLLALLSEWPAAQGIGVDLSEAALTVARGNAERLGLAQRSLFVRSDWFAAIAGRFDVILCNPPYIPSGDIAGLDPEVARFEPSGALDGGADGLDQYRRLAPQLAAFLQPDGIVAFEVGAGQAQAVATLLRHAGLRLRIIRRDLAGIERCIVAGS